MRLLPGLIAILLLAATPALAGVVYWPSDNPANLSNVDNFFDPTLTPPPGEAWSDTYYGHYSELCPGCWWGHTENGILVSFGLLVCNPDIHPLGTPGCLGSDYPEPADWGPYIPYNVDSGSVINSDFTQSNMTTGTGFDFGTLTITCNGATCTASLSVGADATSHFDTNFLAVNLAAGATNLTLAPTVAADCTSPQHCTKVTTNQNVDGWGTFGYSIDLPDGPDNGMPALLPDGSAIFTVDYTGTAASLLFGNSLGNDAATHIMIASGLTGFAVEGEGNQVPEPGTIAVFSAGLLSLGLLRRRRGPPENRALKGERHTCSPSACWRRQSALLADAYAMAC
jgi:hypothetical protein